MLRCPEATLHHIVSLLFKLPQGHRVSITCSSPYFDSKILQEKCPPTATYNLHFHSQQELVDTLTIYIKPDKEVTGNKMWCFLAEFSAKELRISNINIK